MTSTVDTALTGATALVTGASRGFGRAVATALTKAGADVVGVARDGAKLDEVHDELGKTFTPVIADVTDPLTAGALIDVHRPKILVLNAGAALLMRPIHHHTWESFSGNWNSDVRHVFHWVRKALLKPLAPGSTVIAFSSGAAIGGSALSGGYAGAKAAIRFVASYAANESAREELGIRFVSVLPKLTPLTRFGAVGVAGYAEREGIEPEAFADRLGPILTPEHVGAAVTALATDPPEHDAYMLTPDGPEPLV